MEQGTTERKNILLIGDSITIGYCGTVRRCLEGFANVYDVGENCRFSQYILSSLQFWAQALEGVRIDAIHLNCGHWDAAHFCGGNQSLNTPKQYADNLRRIIRVCRILFPDAKLFFATTTPMNPQKLPCTNPRTTEEIVQLNRKGIWTVAGEYGIQVDDLFELTKTWDESCYSDFAHFTVEAYEKIGSTVAGFLQAQLAE